MASTTAPSTPNQQPTIHRSFTLPPKLSDISRTRAAARTPGPDAIETLFAHHLGRIVSFSPSLTASPDSRTTSTEGTGPEGEPVGTLPWISPRERTMAAGPLSVYRVPGSVAFLNSGKTLHPILPKSQCWCVDGETKFVLRIRANNYYRIELPNTCKEDREVADNLKRTFTQVLQYETTPCPFKRGFHIDLPDKPVTPKRPWKPKHRPSSATWAALRPSSSGGDSAGTSDQESTLSSTDDESSSKFSGSQKPSRLDEDSEQMAVLTDQLVSPQTPDHVEDIVSAFEELETPTAAIHPKIFHTEQESALDVIFKQESTQAWDDGLLSVPATVQQTSFTSKQETSDGIMHTGNDSDIAQSLEGGEASPLTPENEQPAPECDKNPIGQDGVDVSGFKWLDTFGDDTSTPMKPKVLSGNRVFTAPPNLEMTPSNIPTASSGPRRKDTDNTSIAESLDSFHSFHSPCSPPATSPPAFHSPISPLPPSPPYSTSSSPPQNLTGFGFEVPRSRKHKHSISATTVLANSSISRAETSISSWPGDPPITSLGSDFEDSSEQLSCSNSQDEDSDSTFRSISRSSSPATSTRRRFKHRRSHSPLPSSANLYTPGNNQFTGHHLTAAVLQKTCNMLLGPPIQLAVLMLNIAARITNGAFRSDGSIHAESGRRIPCSWDSDEDEDSEDDEAWADDYGIPLIGEHTQRKRDGKMREMEGGWEVD